MPETTPSEHSSENPVLPTFCPGGTKLAFFLVDEEENPEDPSSDGEIRRAHESDLIALFRVLPQEQRERLLALAQPVSDEVLALRELSFSCKQISLHIDQGKTLDHDGLTRMLTQFSGAIIYLLEAAARTRLAPPAPAGSLGSGSSASHELG